MTSRFLFLIVLAAAIGTPHALAESTDCTTPVLIVADGRITQSTFPLSTTYWYGIYAQQGHSYSVEFVPAADNYTNGLHVQFSPVAVYGPNDSLQACRGSSSVSVTQNSGYAPVMRNSNGTGRRVSFTATSAGLHSISIANTAASGTYSFRAVDTTLFHPRWSTGAGFDVQWGMMNLSDMPITGTFTAYDVNSNVVGAMRFTIVAGGEVVRTSTAADLNLPRNVTGYVVFSHNGPPNSILADCYMSNSTGTVIVAKKFEPLSTH